MGFSTSPPPAGWNPEDPQGYAARGFPQHVDRAAFQNDLADAVPDHGAYFDDVYRAVGPKHDMSKADFAAAMVALDRDGDLRLADWPRQLDEMPDPDLAVVPVGSGEGPVLYSIKGRGIKRANPANSPNNPR